MRSPAARLSVFSIVATGWAALLPIAHTAGDGDAALDRRLWTALARHGFTGRSSPLWNSESAAASTTGWLTSDGCCGSTPSPG